MFKTLAVILAGVNLTATANQLNGNDIVEQAEIDRFCRMFNSGRGVSKYNDGDKPR